MANDFVSKTVGSGKSIIMLFLGLMSIMLCSCSQNGNWKEQQQNLAILQHENWKKQHEVEQKEILEQRLCEKKTDLISKAVLALKMQELNTWNIWSAKVIRDGQRFIKYWEDQQRLDSQLTVVKAEILIFFGDKKFEVLEIVNNAHLIWHGINLKITDSNVEEDYINQKTNDFGAYLDKLLSYACNPHLAGKQEQKDSKVSATEEKMTIKYLSSLTPYLLPPESVLSGNQVLPTGPKKP